MLTNTCPAPTAATLSSAQLAHTGHARRLSQDELGSLVPTSRVFGNCRSRSSTRIQCAAVTVLERHTIEVVPVDRGLHAQPATAAAPPKAPAMPELGPELRWPTNLHEHIEIGKIIGQGTFGVVHDAVDKRTGKPCAVKGMRKSPRNRHALARLAREATILESLDGCPQVPRLLAKYETARFAYLVMEKAEGECLSNFVRRKGHLLSEAQICSVLWECCSVLQSAHESNVIHADIKPSNFMLAKPVSDIPVCQIEHLEPVLKAVDWGASRVLKPKEKLTELVGSPAYAAPEVFLEHFSVEADMWALGITLFQLVTGQLPWCSSYRELEDMEWDHLTRAVLMQEIPFDNPRWAEMSPACRNLVERLLDRDPYTRITAAEALEHDWFVQWNCMSPHVQDGQTDAGELVRELCPAL